MKGQIRDMKILVTGANGYIGQGVVKQLSNMNIDVIATDIVMGKVHEKAKVMEADIFETKDPYEYFGRPDAVVHLAWRDGFKHNSEAHIMDLSKHYMFLKKMIDAGIKKVCVMGSMHEVGFYEGSINESTPCNPMSLYGIAKNALRNAVQIYADEKKVEFLWLRGFYIVGNVEYGCSIFSKIAQAASEGKKTFPFTTGENQYDFIEYNQFCKQIADAVLQDEISGIVNCCSGYPMKLAERVERFIAENNFDIKLEYGAFPDRLYDSKAVWGNADKIKEIQSKGTK